MILKDLLTIDKTIRRPTVYEQVVNQIVELVDNGLLTAEMSELPDYTTFAKEIGITRIAANKVYNELSRRGYGQYNHDKSGNYTFTINCKELTIEWLEDSIAYALECGISFEDIVLAVIKHK